MLTVHIPGAFNCCQAHTDINMVQEATPCMLMHVNPLIHMATSIGPLKVLCYKSNWSSSRNFNSQLKLQHFSHQITSKRWLCRSQDSISPENEYRSSRNIAISLFRRYRNFVERGGGDNLKEFISAGVNAYALGCTDEGLRKELIDMKDSGVEIEVMQAYGGSTGLKSKIISGEVDECIMWLSIVFITILCTPQPTIVRWSSIPLCPRNADPMEGLLCNHSKCILHERNGLASGEDSPDGANGSNGRAEEPSVVASRMRLVFSTLEVVSPQWPRV
ncbi:hypothetical protein Sango_1368700 [Sesamum angolense]|uniref:DUF7876 domain-containing protein n=1 Tax=Sesamum angolense TaxID=2727404 RepID=A0AAE1WSQ4_9LAMI|nr:hypothetical protein Sango_1368700 [Sesamum angolense]